MNQRSDTDRLLRHWMTDGPSTMPDRVVDVVADRISRQPQRRTRRLQGRLTVAAPFKYGIAAAAVLVVAFVGYSLLPKGSSNVGPGTSPTAVPTATTVPTVVPTAAAVICDNDTRGCLGTLAGGTYSSFNFQPIVTYDVPAGPPAASWTNSLDLTRTYTLMPPGGGFSFAIQSEVAIPEQTADCSTQQKAGVGNAVADWVTFLTEHPGLDSEAPVPVTIGGFQGFSVRFARAASWTATCPGSLGPAILVLMHPGHEGVRWTDDQQETFWVLDVGGATVVITLDSGPTAAEHTRNLAVAQPIIDSFQFTP